MSDIKPNGKVLLVTGINGYIGAVLGSHILAKGYTLRGTARSASSSKRLLDGPYAQYRDRVEIVEVPDITAEEAFDEAVKGVHAIFHVASPVNLSLSTWGEVVVPAVSGTTTLLNSALRHAGPQLASIVVTSSAITITQVTTPPPSANYTYTESDFEDGLIEATKTMTPNSPLYPMRGFIAYGASKTAAEQAVWTFRNTQHPPFAVTTVHPSLVFGAPVLQPTHPSQISASLAFIHEIWAGPSTKGLPDQISTGSWVHVRDVATVHLWAAENPDRADGQRFLATSGFATPQAVADFLRETFPGRKSVVKGSPGKGYREGIDWNGRSTQYWYPDAAERISGERSAREIGLVYQSLEETLEESVGAFELLDRE